MEIANVTVAVSPELVEEMSQGWSQPVRVMIEPARHPTRPPFATHEMTCLSLGIDVVDPDLVEKLRAINAEHPAAALLQAISLLEGLRPDPYAEPPEAGS